MKSDALFSSSSIYWETPQDLFARLDSVFGFDLDVCATPENAKCRRFFTESDDALSQPWSGCCWMNPPYGRQIGRWIEKAYRSAKYNRATVVCLVPARTDTSWWHDYCVRGEVYFLRGRLKFGGAKNSAPFPSAIVVFRPQVTDAFTGHEVTK